MSPRLTRLELILVLALFATGFGLRASYPSRMAVEHFDEGVYASNLYTDAGRYPFQHLYAPPLLPFCLEWAAIFGGPHAVMWVNVVSGSLTLLVLWGMVREWWGPPAAIAAMTLLAFNEFHIAYSRAALTDVMLGLWMTAGVWVGWRAIRSGGPANLAAAGVLAALAWWTKYNGWLTLAITGAGTAGWIVLGGARVEKAGGGDLPPDESPRKSTSKKRTKASGSSRPPLASVPKAETKFSTAKVYLGRWLIMALIAFLAWSPWLWSLQQYGGYAAVAKNHAGYFTGLGQWWPNAVRQVAAIAHDSRALTKLSLALTILAATGIALSQLAAIGRRWVAILTPDDASGACPRPREIPWRERSRELSCWMAAAWLIGLTVAVPLYTPYPRLCLPWVLAAVIALSSLVAVWLFPTNWSETHDPQPDVETPRRAATWKRVTLAIAVFVAASVLLSTLTGPFSPPYPAWENRASLRLVSEGILSRLRSAPLGRAGDNPRCAIAVLAEPGLYFHLASAQRDSVIGHLTLPAADFDLARGSASQSSLPLYIVVGPHAEASHPGEADRLIAAGRLEPVGEFEDRPSDLVLLDGRPAWELPLTDKPVTERIRLLHVKP